MAVYLVTWDLNQEPDYNDVSERLHARLDSLGSENTKEDGKLDSVRFVSTQKTSRELYDFIASGILDADDHIVISRMRSGEYWGWIDKEMWDWISAHL